MIKNIITSLGKGAFLVCFFAITMCAMHTAAQVPSALTVNSSDGNAGAVNPQGFTGEPQHVADNSKEEGRRVDDLMQLVEIQQEKLRELELRQEKVSDNGFNFVTWVGVLLACVTVIVTILGVAIAILTFFGYRATIAKAESVAETVAALKAVEAGEKEIARQFAAGGFDTAIQRAVDKVIYRGLENPELDQDFDGEV